MNSKIYWKYIPVTLIILLLISHCTPDSQEVASKEQESTANPEKYGIDSSMGVPVGLSAGSRAPAFSTRANNGTSFDLYSELQKGPVVVLFYRGKWCLDCNRYMSNFSDSVKYIFEKGAAVVAITPEIRKSANEFAEDTGTRFPIISDPTNTIMNVFDVTFSVTEKYSSSIEKSNGISIAQNNGSNETKLPIPATYVIGQDGYIKYAHFDLNYRNRANVREILRYLERN